MASLKHNILTEQLFKLSLCQSLEFYMISLRILCLLISAPIPTATRLYAADRLAPMNALHQPLTVLPAMVFNTSRRIVDDESIRVEEDLKEALLLRSEGLGEEETAAKMGNERRAGWNG